MGNPTITPEKHGEKYADEIESAEKVGIDFSGKDYTGAVAKTDPAEIKLVRKLDYRIMVSVQSSHAAQTLLTTQNPTLCIMYFLNYVDRNAIAQARLNDLEEDLGMTGTEFNTTVSILFVGYVLMQVPSNMMITKVRPGLYMSGWMLVWAAVSGCTALVQNFGGLVACRFFLGITEAPVCHERLDIFFN